MKKLHRKIQRTPQLQSDTIKWLLKGHWAQLAADKQRKQNAKIDRLATDRCWDWQINECHTRQWWLYVYKAVHYS